MNTGLEIIYNQIEHLFKTRPDITLFGVDFDYLEFDRRRGRSRVTHEPDLELRLASRQIFVFVVIDDVLCDLDFSIRCFDVLPLPKLMPKLCRVMSCHVT